MTESKEPKSWTREIAEHEDFGRAYRALQPLVRPILAGVAGAIVVVLAVSWYQARRLGREEEARLEFLAARTPEDLESVRERFAGTRAAALSAFRLGGERAAQGDWEAALSEFQRFARAHRDHFFAPAAELNIAVCLESLGRLDEAAGAYERFLRSHPGHYLQARAALDRARCAALAGRPDEARILYEDFLAADPGGRWVPQAESALSDLRRGAP